MDGSSLLRHQEIMESESLESMLVCTNQAQRKQQQQEKKPKPCEESVKCPRCDSTNTKFCYYNNYSLSQPRYFCKSCKRYWTQGGTLRNIPVGGGCRKNRRTATSCSSSSSRVRGSTPDHHQFLLHNNNNSNFGGINSLLGLHNNNSPSENCNSHFALDGNYGNSNPNLSFGYLENGNPSEGNSVNYCMGTGTGMQNEEMMMMMLMRSGNNNSSTPINLKNELGENRVIWGIPNNGNYNYMNNIGDYNHDYNYNINHESDLIREIGWNNGHVLGSSFHNLINSPLI